MRTIGAPHELMARCFVRSGATLSSDRFCCLRNSAATARLLSYRR